MTGSGKSLADLAAGFGTGSAIDRALETQRSIDKLTAIGVLGDDRLSRTARGLYSPEMEKAMAIASGKITALDPLLKAGSAFDQLKIKTLSLPDPFEKFGPMRSAIEEAMGKIGRVDTTAFGIAHSTAAKLSLLDGHRFGNLLDDRISEAMKKLTEPYTGLSASMRAALDINRTALGALSRSQHWADALTGTNARDYAALLGIGDKYRKQFEALHLAAGSIAEATAGLRASGAIAEAALGAKFAGIDITTTKMSLFAGAIDVLGPGAGGSQAAYRQARLPHSRPRGHHHPQLA
tara:strand:+ start:10231 stop:11109 length:879 start_codon:yes stop_codon:yes gene_type:complete